jgi:hypothetical protein
MKSMSIWAVQYKNKDWGAFVIEATAARAKVRFHEHFKQGDVADVRLYDQRPANGYKPALITKATDTRLGELGLGFKRKGYANQ